MKKLFIIMVILLIFDVPWISLVATNLYKKLIKSVQNSDLEVRYTSALITYLLLSIGIRYLVIENSKNNIDALKKGMLFGLVSYGIFDFTNYAIFKNWTLYASIIDVLWGTLLCGCVSYVTYNLITKYL